MKIREFFRKWKKGILDLSIEQQIKGRLIGTVGGIVGLILALITLIYRRMWGFGIFVFFVIWIQFMTYIGTRKQYIATKEMMKEVEVKDDKKQEILPRVQESNHVQTKEEQEE